MAELVTEPAVSPATIRETIQTTPLAEYLSATGASPAPYLGVLTPQHLDAPEAENEAVLAGAAVHDLGWLRRIAVRGEDRSRWLSGMVTNNVESLADLTGTYNLILNAQGRIQGDCHVWRSGDTLEIEITANQSEAILAHLDRFIIMDDVELIPVEGQSALGIAGPLADALLTKLGLPALAEPLTSTAAEFSGKSIRLERHYGPLGPRYAIWAASEEIPTLWQALIAAGATPVGAAAVETLRIVEGSPAYGIDIQSRDLAQETAQMRALSFTKGCYLGQEIVERVRSRGQVHRHLRAIEVMPDLTPELSPVTPGEVPVLGTEFQLSGSDAASKPVGLLTSVAALHRNRQMHIFGIAMIRAEAEVGNKLLTYPGGTARILNTPPTFNPATSAAKETQ